ncbi:MAG: hypothetical protein HEQ38_04790 [Gemmatimonas sp.]|nr:hypothetical protein [Gemmatimonas sp.]
MPLALRSHFGALAGGLEHALAIATFVHAVQPSGGTLTPVIDSQRPTSEFDRFSRLVTLLQDVVAHAGYTIDDLRREGFDEPVLSALTMAHRH